MKQAITMMPEINKEINKKIINLSKKVDNISLTNEIESKQNKSKKKHIKE